MPSSHTYTTALSVVCYILLTVSTTTKVSSFSSPRGTTLQLQPQSFISTSVHNAYQYNIISSSRYKSKYRRRGYNNQISLKSSIEDTIETDSDGGDKVSNKEETLLFNSASDAAKANINTLDVISGSSQSNVATIEGSTKQQQIQDVLSSPELLDPASILDATIGNTLPQSNTKDEEDVKKEVPELATNLFDTALDAAASMEDTPESSPSTKAVSSSSTSENAATKSKEEDLELTRLAILKHINRYDLSMNQFDDIEDDNDELGETAQYLDNLQQPNPTFEKDIDKLSEIQVTKKPSEKLTAPSIQKILQYTIPAIGIWLCSPVLSMIDTAAVGLLSGTSQQAALNPAVSVTDYGALVVAFMYTATTNLIAASVQEDKDDYLADSTLNNERGMEQPKTISTLVTAMKLALYVGSIFSVLIFTCGKQLLKLLIGNDNLDPEVFSAALRYVQIRSIGMPAMVVIGTAQSASLGMQDVTSPLYVLLAAAVINFLGDVLLVPMKSGLFGGAAGAAWATVASQYAALLFFARWLTTSSSSSVAEEDEASGSSTDGKVIDKRSWEVPEKVKTFIKYLSSSKLARRARRAACSSAGSGRFIEDASVPEVTTIPPSRWNVKIRRSKSKKQKKAQPKTLGFLSNSGISLRSYLSLSNLNMSKAAQFLPFVIPVTTTSGKSALVLFHYVNSCV